MVAMRLVRGLSLLLSHSRSSSSPSPAVSRRFLQSVSSSSASGAHSEVVPNEPLSSSFAFTRDGGKLTEEQRRFYEENGFLVMRKLVPPAQLAKYEARFKEIANGAAQVPGMLVQKDISFKERARDENTVYKLQELFLDAELFAYCGTPAILDYVACFCGADVMAIHTMLINKPPDAGTKSSRHPLHQDLLYFPIRPANAIVCAWTAMERVTRDNGCLVAVPGSHKGPLLEHAYPDWEAPMNALYHGVKGVAGDAMQRRVFLEMGAGDTVLFHPLLIHGSGANRTSGYRKAISCHYASSHCQYVDVTGTLQQQLAQEVIDIAKKRTGMDVDDYSLIWRMRAQLVRGNRVNL